MDLPKKSPASAPNARKGPKGTSWPFFNLPARRQASPTKTPATTATASATAIPSGPTKTPIIPANGKSPQPIASLCFTPNRPKGLASRNRHNAQAKKINPAPITPPRTACLKSILKTGISEVISPTIIPATEICTGNT